MGNCCGSRRLPGFNRCRKLPREATKSYDEDVAHQQALAQNTIPLSAVNNHLAKHKNSVQNPCFETTEDLDLDTNNNKPIDKISAQVNSELNKSVNKSLNERTSIVHENPDAHEQKSIKSRKQSIAESIAKSISILNGHDSDSKSNDSYELTGEVLRNIPIQHIADREEPDDLDDVLTPSDKTKSTTFFLLKALEDRRKLHANVQKGKSETFAKKYSSCATINLDDSTVSAPNQKAMIKCVSLAIYYHIRHRKNATTGTLYYEEFDEKKHPLTKEPVPNDYDQREPDHKQVYRFIRTLFHAAQLNAECAIIMLVYMERLMTYAELRLEPSNWKWVVLGAIILASKVWDDQAVWNVDYCQILQALTVRDINNLERQYLELLQFNTNVAPSIYVKYYFELRQLAAHAGLHFVVKPLTNERALELDASSRLYAKKIAEKGMSKPNTTLSTGEGQAANPVKSQQTKAQEQLKNKLALLQKRSFSHDYITQGQGQPYVLS